MRVDITHTLKEQGFFKPIPFYEVWVSVAFTDHELDIIHDANLYDFHIANRRPHPHSGSDDADDPLILRQLIDHDPEGYAFASLPAAKAYEQEVIDGLTRIRRLIETNTDPAMSRREIIE